MSLYTGVSVITARKNLRKDISDKHPGNDKAVAGLPLLICSVFLIHPNAGPRF